MNWEQKLYALNALAEAKLLMRKPGDWYVSQSAEIKNGAVLEGSYGNVASPEEAVEDHWETLTRLAPGQYIVVRAFRDDRKAVRWNGFMWEAVIEDRNTGGSSGSRE